MIHKWDKKYNITFFILLGCGIGLCIGGVWVAPLLIPGGVCLAGAFGMFASAYTRMYPWRMDEPEDKTTAHEMMGAKKGFDNDVELQSVNRAVEHGNINILIEDNHIELHPHFDMIERPHRPSLEMQEAHQYRSAPQLTII